MRAGIDAISAAIANRYGGINRLDASVRTAQANSAEQQDTCEICSRRHIVHKLSQIERTMDAGEVLARLIARVSLNTRFAQL